MRTFTNNLREHMYSASAPIAFLTLMKIKHTSLSSSIYLVENNESVSTYDLEDTTQTGSKVDYLPAHFKYTPRSMGEDKKEASITIGAVDRTIITALREVPSELSIIVAIVKSDDFDSIEFGPNDYLLRGVSYDAMTVTGSLSIDHHLTASFPYNKFIPKHFPGLF